MTSLLVDGLKQLTSVGAFDVRYEVERNFHVECNMTGVLNP